MATIYFNYDTHERPRTMFIQFRDNGWGRLHTQPRQADDLLCGSQARSRHIESLQPASRAR